MKSNNNISLHSGLPTLLLTLMSLCLISFATLTLVTAKVNSNLTNKSIEHQKLCLEAYNNAQEDLFNTNELLRSHVASCSEEEFQNAIAAIETEFKYSIDSNSYLSVKITPCYNPTHNSFYYTISEWVITSSIDSDCDYYLNVIP